jgi:hypothetical protein
VSSAHPLLTVDETLEQGLAWRCRVERKKMTRIETNVRCVWRGASRAVKL